MIVECAACGSSNRVPARRAAQRARCGRCKAAIAGDRPIVARSAEDFDELVRDAEVPVVVDFWAAWCGPCRVVAPELEKLAEARAGSVIVAKLDTEAVPEIAARYGIRSIPTFVRFDRGEETQRASGAMPAAALAQSLGL